MNYVFFLSGFSFKYTDDSQNNRKRDGDHFLLHSTTSTYSRTFIHLIKILHVRWLSWDQCNDHNDVKYIWFQSQKMLELFCSFFYQDFLSPTLSPHRIAGEEKDTIFYSTLTLLLAHEHSDI